MPQYPLQSHTNSNGVVVLKNQRILLMRRPDGLPKREDFRLEVQDLKLPASYFNSRSNATNNASTSSSSNSTTNSNSNSTGKSDLLLETLSISIDPAMRGWMSSAKSYLPPVKLGSVMRASAIAKVVAAESGVLHKEFPIGSIVKTEIVGVQAYCLLKNCTAQKARKLLTRLDHYPLPIETSNLSYASFLGVLGTTGLTAYFGLLKVGMPKTSDTVLVSGAAGATGSIVAQIAKHVVGCKRVIGTAGTDAKCQWLEANGIVDVAINYKKAPNLAKAIYKASGKSNKSGIDLVFDNVGSTFLEAALSNLAMNAKIVLCGAISQYNVPSGKNNSNSAVASGPRNYMNLLVKRATMTGFVVLDYKNEFPTAISDLVQWIKEGKIHCYKEDTTHSGISNFYPALLSLFQGTNVGKVVLRVGTKGHRSKL